MPRKPTVRNRARAPSRLPARPTGRMFHQCTVCGGLVNEAFVSGDDSWCPHCKAQRLIVTEIGRIPIPTQYGEWLLQQSEQPNATPAPTPALQAPESTASPASRPLESHVSRACEPTYGDPTMKQPKTHTGTYSCLDCYTEYELTAEKSLRCDCGGLLVKGTLEELGVDDADLYDEDE